MNVKPETHELRTYYPELRADGQPMLLNHQLEDAASINPRTYPATTSEM